jgi:hypothetical protein
MPNGLKGRQGKSASRNQDPAKRAQDTGLNKTRPLVATDIMLGFCFVTQGFLREESLDAHLFPH